MAFSSEQLTVLAFADGYTLWHYATEDSTAEVSKPGYFDAARELVRNRDRIEVYAADTNFDAMFTVLGRVKLKRLGRSDD
jgi:hypothetical protein